MKLSCSGHNLGTQARRLSLRFGVFCAAVTLAMGFTLAEVGLASRLGFLLIVPLTLSAYGLLAGLSGNCFWTGMRGGRQADYGFEPVLDPGQIRNVRRRGWALLTASLLVASVSASVFTLSV